MKKVLAIAAVAALTAGVSAYAANPFSDVTPNDWAYQAVEDSNPFLLAFSECIINVWFLKCYKCVKDSFCELAIAFLKLIVSQMVILLFLFREEV